MGSGMIDMDLTKELSQYVEALRITSGSSLHDLLQRSQAALEKLEQDRKVLRWALLQARDALIDDKSEFNRGVLMSIIDTANSMTEPANDR